MNNQTLTFDYLYKYSVEDTREGGIGWVFLMSQIAGPPERGPLGGVLQRIAENDFRYPYRKKLAGKTVKDTGALQDFFRECNIWLGFDEKGIVPLLKVVNADGIVLALMPRYSGNLQELISTHRVAPQHLLKSLHQPINGLSALYARQGIVHQDIKPANFLYEMKKDGLTLSLADWGIANVKAGIRARSGSSLSEFAVATMGGVGTLAYMSPERFGSYVSNIRADIFSLGMVIFEILTGKLPYRNLNQLPDEITSGEYYYTAMKSLSTYPTAVVQLVLSMLHPSENKRPDTYKGILRLLKNI